MGSRSWGAPVQTRVAPGVWCNAPRGVARHPERSDGPRRWDQGDPSLRSGRHGQNPLRDPAHLRSLFIPRDERSQHRTGGLKPAATGAVHVPRLGDPSLPRGRDARNAKGDGQRQAFANEPLFRLPTLGIRVLDALGDRGAVTLRYSGGSLATAAKRPFGVPQGDGPRAHGSASSTSMAYFASLRSWRPLHFPRRREPFARSGSSPVARAPASPSNARNPLRGRFLTRHPRPQWVPQWRWRAPAWRAGRATPMASPRGSRSCARG